jgi:hypothetical protein
MGIGTPFLPAGGVKFAKGRQILAKLAFHLRSCGNLGERETMRIYVKYGDGLLLPGSGSLRAGARVCVPGRPAAERSANLLFFAQLN